MAPSITLSFCVLYLLLGFLPSVWSARILLIPFPEGGHLNLGLTIGEILKDNGHDVWVLSSDYNEKKTRSRGLKCVTYPSQYLKQSLEDIDEQVMKSMFNPSGQETVSTTSMMGKFRSMNRGVCNDLLNNQDVRAQIQSLDADLAFVGTSLLLGCLYEIPRRHGIPYVTMSPWDLNVLAGVTALPSFQPNEVSPVVFTPDMTFMERTISFLLYFNFFVFRWMTVDVVEGQPTSTEIVDAISHSEMWFISQETMCVDYPRLSAPHYVFVGGISAREPKPLTGELKQLLDSATNGLVFVTFGSTKTWGQVLQTLLPVFIKAFEKLDQQFLIQYRLEAPENMPSNVHFQSWVPQNDLLGHPNTKLMISHGGSNGQIEAVYHGVPMLCIPVQNEQQYNCRRIVYHNYGLTIPVLELNADDLHQAVHQLITNETYKNNVTKCSNILHDAPNPRSKVAFWVNHLLQYGSLHLKPTSSEMSLFSLFMFDIMFCIGGVTFAVCISLLAVCRWCCRRR